VRVWSFVFFFFLGGLKHFLMCESDGLLPPCDDLLVLLFYVFSFGFLAGRGGGFFNPDWCGKGFRMN